MPLAAMVALAMGLARFNLARAGAGAWWGVSSAAAVAGAAWIERYGADTRGLYRA